MTTDGAAQIAQQRERLLAGLVELQKAADIILELTLSLPHQILNLESLASDAVRAAWMIHARILEVSAALLVLEEGSALLATDPDGSAARWPPTPANVIWRATHP